MQIFRFGGGKSIIKICTFNKQYSIIGFIPNPINENPP